MILKWRHCELADEEHRQARRQYAHVFHFRREICVAQAIWELPPVYRDAILMHEAGHILVGPEGSETAATSAAENFFGVRIRYIDSPYGERLEKLMPRRNKHHIQETGEELPYDQWIPAHAVRFNSDGTISLMEEGGGHYNPDEDPLWMQHLSESGELKKGALHRQLGIPAGERIPTHVLRAATKEGGKLAKRAQLALRFRGQ